MRRLNPVACPSAALSVVPLVPVGPVVSVVNGRPRPAAASRQKCTESERRATAHLRRSSRPQRAPWIETNLECPLDSWAQVLRVMLQRGFPFTMRDLRPGELLSLFARRGAVQNKAGISFGFNRVDALDVIPSINGLQRPAKRRASRTGLKKMTSKATMFRKINEFNTSCPLAALQRVRL